MTLQEQLEKQLTQVKGKISAETQTVMEQATIELINTGIAEQTLQVGDTLPPISLPNAVGKTVNIQELLTQGAVVISFYRGQWCPYCNLELRALQQALPDILANGASLVAISPQTPDNSLSTTEKNELTFEVLSDIGNQVAKQLGLVFPLPEQLRPIYQNFGIDLPAHNGDTTFELPIPATYVISRDGKVVQAFVNPDYTQRIEPLSIIETLQKLQSNI